MIYRQYSNATNLISLINGLYPYLTISVDDFFHDYFDINTCNRQGLNNWGAILNVSGSIAVPALNHNFGFDTGAGQDDNGYPENFNNNNGFYNGGTLNTDLTDQAYRTLIKFRYKFLTCNMSILSANIIMNEYAQQSSSSNQVIVNTTSPMNIKFTFNYTLLPWEFTIFNLDNVLPVPTGVNFTIVQP